MKKKITQLRWLATMLMLVAAMVMPSTAWAQESTVTFTAKEGTVGFNNESFDIKKSAKKLLNVIIICKKIAKNSNTYIMTKYSQNFL